MPSARNVVPIDLISSPDCSPYKERGVFSPATLDHRLPSTRRQRDLNKVIRPIVDGRISRGVISGQPKFIAR
jgi:ribosomal protein L15E